MNPITVQAFLFDMDGTLIDSIAVVDRVLRDFSAKYGLDPDEVSARAHGRPLIDNMIHYLGDNELARKEAELFTQIELSTLDGVVALPGAAEILSILPDAAWALVTSASRELALRRMQAVGLPLPSTLITADDVQQGKPHPQPYLLAAQKLGVPIEHCLVLEDAPAGIQAGLASGARVLVVNDHADVEGLAVHGVCRLSEVEVVAGEGGFEVRPPFGVR